jgi:hypothetical protein
MSAIDTARDQTQTDWQDYFGVELPESVARADYAVSSEEYEQVQASVRLIDPLLIDSLRSSMKAGHVDAAAVVGVRAATLRKRAFRKVLELDVVNPKLELIEPLMSGCPLLNTENRLRGAGERSLDCAVTVFGMNAVSLITNELSPGDEFDSSTASSTIRSFSSERHEGADYDLPWMLGSLTTHFAEAQSKYRVRVITTIGADFGEIESGVIKPLRASDPELQFLLNAVIISDVTRKSNHTVNIIGASNGEVATLDPKYGMRPMPSEYFWDRWTETNMQAVLVALQPQTVP